MNLSFKPSSAGASLWWAICWRSFAIGALLFVPLFVLMLAVQVGMGFGLMFAATWHPYLAIGATLAFILLNVFVQWFLIPVTVYAGVFRWLFKRGSFGSYTIAGTHRGQPVTSFGKAFKYSAWFFLENFKYVWPLFFGGIFIGVLADNDGNLPPHAMLPILLFMPLSIYLYMLTLTDLIKRRSFNKLQLIVTPRIKPEATPVQFDSVDIKPRAKAVVQATQPAAKPSVKAVVQTAPKTVAKPVAKPKPSAKPVAKPLLKGKKK
ncbi:MAG: hypothetical protein EON60_05990 [Alphaproteobacteria bacterium]|nr:MAG: hypothetical protein EON60_05990 [Alphaproteobacteria bacterium]